MSNYGNTIYHPYGVKLKCAFIDCLAGMGLAGSGRCFLHGMWWHPSFPNFIDEETYMEKWEKEQ